MPKERIYTIPGPDGSYVAYDIGWGSDVGAVSLTASTYAGADAGEDPSIQVSGSDLTYQQVNRIIKMLRRARDGAFGKPE